MNWLMTNARMPTKIVNPRITTNATAPARAAP